MISREILKEGNKLFFKPENKINQNLINLAKVHKKFCDKTFEILEIYSIEVNGNGTTFVNMKIQELVNNTRTVILAPLEWFRVTHIQNLINI